MGTEYIPTAPSPVRQDQGILVLRRMLSHPLGRVFQAASLNNIQMISHMLLLRPLPSTQKPNVP